MPIDVPFVDPALRQDLSDEELTNLFQRWKTAKEQRRVSTAGAPILERARTAFARTPEDELATVQQTHPEAVRDEGNIIFKGPSGQPTYYNPPGFDLGDVGELGPMVPEAIGGAAGASLGGIPGAGVGTMAGSAISDIIGGRLGVEDTRSMPNRMLDYGVSGVTGAGGQAAGGLLSRAMRTATRPVMRRMTGAGPLLQDFQAINAPVSAGAITGNRSLQAAEANAATGFGGASTMQSTYQGQNEAIQREIARLVGTAGGSETRTGLGQTLKTAATGADERFREQQNQLYEEAYALIDPQTPVDLQRVEELYQRLQGRLRVEPENQGTIGVADRLIYGNPADRPPLPPGTPPQPMPLTFEEARRARSAARRRASARPMGAEDETAAPGRRQLEGALSEDLNAVTEQIPGGREALRRADVFTREFNEPGGPAQYLQQITKTPDADKAFDLVLGQGGKNTSMLIQLRRQFQPQEWDRVVGTVVDRLGRVRPGGLNETEFSVANFLSNYDKLRQNPETMHALFSGTQYRGLQAALDRLMRVSRATESIQKIADPTRNSATAIRQGLGKQAGMTVGGLTLMQAGRPLAGAGTIAVGALGPYLTAGLMTSPRFVNWLAGAQRAAGGNQSIGSWVGRLLAIGQAEPRLRDEVNRLAEAIQMQGRPQ